MMLRIISLFIIVSFPLGCADRNSDLEWSEKLGRICEQVQLPSVFRVHTEEPAQWFAPIVLNACGDIVLPSDFQAMNLDEVADILKHRHGNKAFLWIFADRNCAIEHILPVVAVCRKKKMGLLFAISPLEEPRNCVSYLSLNPFADLVEQHDSVDEKLNVNINPESITINGETVSLFVLQKRLVKVAGVYRAKVLLSCSEKSSIAQLCDVLRVSEHADLSVEWKSCGSRDTRSGVTSRQSTFQNRAK